MTIPETDRTRLTRMRERQVFDRAALDEILDEALIAHVGLARDFGPVVLPMLFARDGDDLLVHGSSGGGLFRQASQGAPIGVGVTIVDGLVFARSTFDSSMNYRSALLIGVAEAVTDPRAKARALEVLSERIMPGRPAELRETTAKERAATLVLRLPIEEASVKVRAAGPSDDDGADPQLWAGVVPLVTRTLTPVSADGVEVPPSPAAEAFRAQTDARRPPYC
ncbi:pyridoxamine 5'-phosphate oxidase family protein [Microbacteriaceae bacterium VKM Ac-2855]|nr:pyridoxamine 5'-phosphate oxidase family protein [Microbacteriaceae bacterium VKM Ac-2855]